ncbi:RICIN domain-containing protein [Streptomyces violaceorubidus]|uniref:RICIN domain-containing protein n=1 Tax=Streptomyces violaceorubidus TaxID=284042 RepID=UPI00068A2865|nr:RICIN domain-containing protein [Streptomyces violaceorubidus]
MTPPPAPPPTGDLPKRVPGSGKKVSPSPASGRPDLAPDRPDAAPRAAGREDSLPRLTQFSSLGSRSHFDGPREEPAASRPSSPPSAQDRPGGFLRRPGDRARREGLRGALGVVGVVGLLAAGAVALVLVLTGQDEGVKDGASVSVDGGDYRPEDIYGPGGEARPSASASPGDKGKNGKDGKASPAPSATASPTGSASAQVSKAPGDKAGAPAGSTPGAGQETSASPSGVSVVSHASQRCLDVVGGRPVAGARLMIWDCRADSASQRWTFPADGTMRSLGMCVQLAQGSTADGAELQLARCDGGDAQQFELNQRHDIVNGPADKCADVQDALTDNGTRIQLWSCNGLDQQKWSRS